MLAHLSAGVCAYLGLCRLPVSIAREGWLHFAGSLCNNFWCDWGLKAEDIGRPVNESAKRLRMNK